MDFACGGVEETVAAWRSTFTVDDWASVLDARRIAASGTAMYKVPEDGSTATPEGSEIEAGSGPGKVPLTPATPTTVVTTPPVVTLLIRELYRSAT
jgi:hypothetical protein